MIIYFLVEKAVRQRSLYISTSLDNVEFSNQNFILVITLDNDHKQRFKKTYFVNIIYMISCNAQIQ